MHKMPKKGDTIKKQHAAGMNKMRCPGCHVGMMVIKQDQTGRFYECERCHRRFGVQPLA